MLPRSSSKQRPTCAWTAGNRQRSQTCALSLAAFSSSYPHERARALHACTRGHILDSAELSGGTERLRGYFAGTADVPLLD